jgi:hypothetical protein
MQNVLQKTGEHGDRNQCDTIVFIQNISVFIQRHVIFRNRIGVQNHFGGMAGSILQRQRRLNTTL